SLTVRRGEVIVSDLCISGTAVVEGRVEGSVACDRLVVTEGGEVIGPVRTASGGATVRGAVRGRVLSRGLLVVGPAGSIRGDVDYERMQVQAGGRVEGCLDCLLPPPDDNCN
ncbi:unnamed protein product, partial [Phaeothamnion confervicola]